MTTLERSEVMDGGRGKESNLYQQGLLSHIVLLHTEIHTNMHGLVYVSMPWNKRRSWLLFMQLRSKGREEEGGGGEEWGGGGRGGRRGTPAGYLG